VTAIFCVVFVMVEGPLAIRASTVVISLCATTMYAVLYGSVLECRLFRKYFLMISSILDYVAGRLKFLGQQVCRRMFHPYSR
jgi:hypothetical protein